MSQGAFTLWYLRRVATVIEIVCDNCPKTEEWPVHQLVERFGPSLAIPAIPDRTMFGCERRDAPFMQRCRGRVRYVDTIKLSEMGDSFMIKCPGRFLGRPCNRHKEVHVDRWIRQYGDIPVDDFLKRLQCSICKTKGARLE